jgi:hypothetical protein
MSPEDEVRRAGKAKEILENEIFKESVQEVHDALISGIKQAAFKDKELVLALSQELRALDGVLVRLRSVVETGVMAEVEIERRSVSDRIREFIS